MTTTQNTLIAAIVAFACTAGVSTYVLQKVKARSSSARVAVNAPRPVSDRAADPSARVAATAAPATASEGADAETGILRTPDGKPLPDADVYLSTTSLTVPIYSGPPPKVSIARTGAD